MRRAHRVVQHLVVWWLAVVVSTVLVALPGHAVQRMYAGQLRMGFGDAGPTLDPSPGATMGTLEFVDDRNKAIPACAAPGATITPSGAGNYPPITSMGAGPNTGTVDFLGLADVSTTPAGAIDPAQPIQLLAPAPTPAGLHSWGLVVSCPAFADSNLVGLFFRRTRMAALSWPSITASIGPGLGAVPLRTVKGSVSPASVILSFTPTRPIDSRPGSGPQRLGAIGGPQRFGGSVGIAGSVSTTIGVTQLPFVLSLSAIGTSVIPLAIGRNGGAALTPSGATGRVPTFSAISTLSPFKLVTDPVAQRQIGGPLPPPSGPNYPLPPFARAAGFAWTTGVVTAFDSIGWFRTTRTRAGFPLDAIGPFSLATTARLQLVSPSVVFRGLATLIEFGQALTAEMEIRFLPEPAPTTALVSGATALAWLRAARRARRRRTPR